MSAAEESGENLAGKGNNTVNLNTKRGSYLAWEDYFMSIAFLSAQRSKDPSTQVGACIVNNEKKIVGIGYNGMPTGCSDDILPWSRVGKEFCDTKYAYGMLPLYIQSLAQSWEIPVAMAWLASLCPAFTL